MAGFYLRIKPLSFLPLKNTCCQVRASRPKQGKVNPEEIKQNAAGRVLKAHGFFSHLVQLGLCFPRTQCFPP